MNNLVLKALWLSLLIGVAGGVVLSFQMDSIRLSDEEIEQWWLKQQNP